MDQHRKFWNTQQKSLRLALSNPQECQKAIDLFLAQHAMIHAGVMSGMGLHSFEDEVWDGLSDVVARCIPPKFEHSIVWCFWHLTRIEDVTMNLLVAGNQQLLLRDGWFERMGVTHHDTGNGMDIADITKLSDGMDIQSLRNYRLVVGRRTRETVQKIQSEDIKRRVDPAHLAQILADGTVTESSRGVVDYWGGLTIAGLLLMPPTRHSLVHLNEALKIKHNCTVK